MINSYNIQRKIAQQSTEDYSYIKVIAIAQTQQQRLAFSDTVRSMGLSLVDCTAPSNIKEIHHRTRIDVWLVDGEYDDKLYDKLNPANRSNTVLVGFSKAPFLNETQLYAKWQRKLQRKLASMLNLPELISSKVYIDANKPWKFVVFLGASMGGPAAVKAFLDSLSPDLPVTIILAHHFNHNMINTLPRILSRHNDWKCQVISTSQTLQSGSCLIAPINEKVVCDSTGRVILTKEHWEEEYKPCIGDLLKNTSDVYGNELIGIIFSGMGDDGSQHIDLIRDNQSQIWAQDPNSSHCPSQPKAIIETGICQFIGTSEELAEKLTEYVKERILNIE